VPPVSGKPRPPGKIPPENCPIIRNASLMLTGAKDNSDDNLITRYGISLKHFIKKILFLLLGLAGTVLDVALQRLPVILKTKESTLLKVTR